MEGQWWPWILATVFGVCVILKFAYDAANKPAEEVAPQSSAAPAAGNVIEGVQRGSLSGDVRLQAWRTGEAVRVEGLTYTVVRARWTDRLTNQFAQRPNAKYLLIEVAIRNDDRRARTIPAFQLLDLKGAFYDEDGSAWASLSRGHTPFAELNPHVEQRMTIAFDALEGTYVLIVGEEERAAIELEFTNSLTGR